MRPCVPSPGGAEYPTGSNTFRARRRVAVLTRASVRALILLSTFVWRCTYLLTLEGGNSENSGLSMRATVEA